MGDEHTTVGTTSEFAELSDDDLRVFLDMSTELFGIFDPARGLVWSNPSSAKTLGYQPEELQGMHLAALLHPDDLAGASAVINHAPDGQEIPRTETRYRFKDGSWRWLEWAGAKEYGTGIFFGVARDVTERHIAQNTLRDNEQRIQAILDHSAAVIFVKELDGRYVLVNHAFLRASGLRLDEVIGRTSGEIWGSEAGSGADLDGEVMLTGTAVTVDDAITIDGEPHTLMTVRFPLRDEAGAVIGMAAIGSDITERTAVEQALAERERLLDTIVRACPDIVTVLDRHGRVEEVSQASARILGYDVAHPVHEELESLLHPDDVAVIYEEYGKLLGGRQQRLDMRYRVRHTDGHWVTLDTRGQAIVDADGKPRGAVVVSRDVTDDLAFEEELRAAVATAERASTAKSAFLSRMSHELRTPLNSVLGFAQLLDMDVLEEQQHEAVGHILRAGHHLLSLIDEVLDIARIESGRLDLVLGPVAVRKVVHDAVDLTRPVAEDRGIVLTLDLGDLAEDAHVTADRQRLLQVLLNLLSNGVKYNRQDGTLNVSVRCDGEVTVFTVTDTGFGIDPADAGRVFEPFDRLGAERSGVQGTGVGLTLSKHLVEQMGGTIELSSESGEGATFLVRLPSSAPPFAATPATNTPPIRSPRVGGTLRVLHIEDNLANLELVEQILSRLPQVELLAAMSGSLGLELAKEHHPDLVLLDLHLPDMTGSDVLQQLRDDPGTTNVPVVVVSADATAAQVRRLRSNGAMAYFTKPIDVHELLSAVEMVAARGTS